MQKLRLILLTVIGASFFSAAFAGEGAGVKNGGSGYLCGDEPLSLAEVSLARRFSPVYEIADRDVFFQTILARIPDPMFRQLLAERWEMYGDSEFWPSGTLDDTTVYYFFNPKYRVAYGPQGRIPAQNTAASTCESTSVYSPDDCCDRVLISYFGPDSKMPTRLESHYRMLNRVQKNILELHEAVYRTAWELAKQPISAHNPYIEEEVASYRRLSEFPADMPSVYVANLVAELISKDIGAASVGFSLDMFKLWSTVLR